MTAFPAEAALPASPRRIGAEPADRFQLLTRVTRSLLPGDDVTGGPPPLPADPDMSDHVPSW